MFGVNSLLLFVLFINVLVNGYEKEQRGFKHAKGFKHVRQASSWDSYIDNLIAQSKDASGTPHVDKACIIGLDGGAKYTSDSHPNALKLSATERTSIATPFKSKNFTPFMNDGITAEGTTYSFLREEDDIKVYAKKQGHGALSLQRSKTAIVIAHCPEGSQQGNANKAVRVIAEYLISFNQ